MELILGMRADPLIYGIHLLLPSLSQWTLKNKSLNLIFPTKYGIPKSSKGIKIG